MEESLVLGTLGEQVKSRVKSQESREASLAAAQNKHEADAACSGMCAQGQDSTGQERPGQSPTALLLRKGNTRAACISIINNQDLDRASRFRPPPPPAIKAHQPSSAQCIFATQAYPDTHISSCKSLQSMNTPPQPNKTLLCPAAVVSDSRHDVSPAVRPFNSSVSLSPIKTQTQTLFLSEPAQPHLWFSLLRVCGSASPVLSCFSCLAHLPSAFLGYGGFRTSEGPSV